MRPTSLESRKKVVALFAQQVFDEQLTRSPFCVPEENGGRYRQLSQILNAIQKSLVCVLHPAQPHVANLTRLGSGSFSEGDPSSGGSPPYTRSQGTEQRTNE